jgi:kynurenine formamidase
MATIDEFRRVADRIRNWGRWGPNDELGTLNFITATKVQEAAQLVRHGKIFPLGIPFDDRGPQGNTPFRTNPIHHMTVDGGDGRAFAERVLGLDLAGAGHVTNLYENGLLRFNDDFISMPLQCASQWDALSHVYYEEQLYNGYPADTVTSFGAARVGIDKVQSKGIVSRAVLLDVARAREVTTIEADAPSIFPDELESVAGAQGVEIRSGDILLVRTGWWTEFARSRDRSKGWNGLSWRCAEWLHAHEVAAVAADNIAVEGGTQDLDLPLAFHMLCLRDMGMMLGEIWDLDALAVDCAEDGVYEFQLIASPLRVTGGVGSPVNPLAIK